MMLTSSARFLVPALALLAVSLPAHAATITGTVSDRTTNKVAANDTVVLIGFGQGMQELARTTTDAHGHYSIEAPDDGGGRAGGTHLIRVDHQKATYFQPAPAGAHTVDVDVFDVAEKVKGLSTEADVLTMQTDPSGLHVVENYFVKNDSQPAMTQLSRHAYEIYLPSGATIEATAAMGPGGMPVASSPIPVGDPKTDPGHYAFVFPVRPGETRFQVSYHLAYSGSLGFSQRVALPTENLVVILPKTMQFTPHGTDFQPVPDNVATQTFVRKGVAPAQAISFTVAGSGVMPREVQGADVGASGTAATQANGGQTGTAQGSPTAAQPDSTAPDTRPGGGLGPPIDTPDPLHKYKWGILSLLALALVIAAAFLLRKPRIPAPGTSSDAGATPPVALSPSNPTPSEPGRQAGPVPPSGPTYPSFGGQRNGPAGGSLLTALKEALFALEAERLGGHTSEEEYRRLKSSLEVVLRQVLERETARQ